MPCDSDDAEMDGVQSMPYSVHSGGEEEIVQMTVWLGCGQSSVVTQGPSLTLLLIFAYQSFS